ncbi:protein TIC 40, chloroplastic isoform X2 [Vigna unguiculata]|uniref:protein TIC 40, chloroplastic isoform X2 n=1 Tax=Vigna unguiculata TaxID=3917 RepID=UPI001015FE71|nr:protein TIC 40, chloroplastic isoform X2 [Vigna unguiculata]
MENLNLALVSSSKPLMLGRVPARDAADRDVLRRKPFSFGRVLIAPHRCRYRVSALSSSHHGPKSVQEKVVVNHFASVSSSKTQETTSVGVNPQLSPPPSSTIGSPLFWIGVGVGFSALFSMVASRLKKYAMQQAFKTMMGQMNSQNNQFGNAAFSPGSPFPFSMPSAAGPTVPAGSATAQSRAPSTSSRSQSTITVDIPATKVEATGTADIKDQVEVQNEPKKIDVTPEETVQKSPFESVKDDESSSVKEKARVPDEVSQNGVPFNQGFGGFPGSQSTKKSVLSVDALEKMMEDPTVQKMVYPYLPEEMRNPDTFKWMLQNPQYRQQLEEMLSNMGGTEWDSQMMDTLKNFDLNSPQVKQQFDQIGLSPEEVVSKIMANPDVAMAFQNPRVQAAIMDCSQNPMNITKYQNDKEIMDVFNKISELFPGVGSP